MSYSAYSGIPLNYVWLNLWLLMCGLLSEINLTLKV